MNEFEWRRQMRDLNQPVTPRNDLWARIEVALEDAAPQSNRATRARVSARLGRTWALAASFAAIAVLACGIVWRMHTLPGTTRMASHPAIAEKAPWKPSDPRLAGAAVELDAARIELQQAMRQAPDSPALQRLLQQTNAQQNRLRELEKQAG